MIERTLVFVDTSYLLASFYNSWEEGARGQLEISLANVVQTLNHHARLHVNQPVQRQFWYDGIPDTGPHRYQRTLRVIEGVQLRAGQLIEWGDRRTQKAVDTLLVADMVTAALRGQCTDIVLVSGDADMIPGVRAAVDAGVRVHLLGFGWDSIASTLRHHCDTATVLDPRTDFADCMQIRVLEGPLTPTVRGTARPVHPGHDGHDDDEAGEALDTPGSDAQGDDRPAPDTMAADLRSGRARAESVADEALGDHAHCSAEDEEAAVARVEGVGPEQPEAAGQGGDPDDGDATGDPVVPATGAPVVPATGTPVVPASDNDSEDDGSLSPPVPTRTSARPNPSMMAGRRRPLRSRYVPLSDEVWSSSGETTPFDVGQQYATWWYEQGADERQRDDAHLLSGGILPPEVDRPLLQFACQVLNEFTLTEYQRVSLRDGFHEGIRAVLLKHS